MSGGIQSTRIGGRPQAVLHPSGNRGADLIETIRLERLSTQLADKGPAPNDRLFIRPHHTDPSAQTRRSRPGVGGPGPASRPWAERRWTRPASAGQMQVHSTEALRDMLATQPPLDNASRQASPLPGMTSPKGEVASVGSSVSAKSPQQRSQTRRRPQSAQQLATIAQKERLHKQQMENHRRDMRKLRETQEATASREEEQFQKSWERYNAEQNGPVAEIERMLRLKDMEYMRRATASAKEWNEEVFERIQTQITRGLRKREADGSYNTRWRDSQDSYLRTLAKKDAGIFRDIVIENEYDPLANQALNIKYSSKKVDLRDPLKLELRKHEEESRMVPGSAASLIADEAKSHGTLGRECFDVKLWPHIEATPYGHINHVDLRAPKSKPHISTFERVMPDHYNIPRRAPQSRTRLE